MRTHHSLNSDQTADVATMASFTRWCGDVVAANTSLVIASWADYVDVTADMRNSTGLERVVVPINRAASETLFFESESIARATISAAVTVAYAPAWNVCVFATLNALNAAWTESLHLTLQRMRSHDRPSHRAQRCVVVISTHQRVTSPVRVDAVADAAAGIGVC